MVSWLRVAALSLAVIGLRTGAAKAQVVTEFSAGITPGASLSSITSGPDGSLWFTEYWDRKIGRITPLGVVTEFAGVSFSPSDIRVGPDGNVWFSGGNYGRLGRITPLGAITEFDLGVEFTSFALGPDGNWWITESVGRIGRFTPGTGTLTQFTDGISASSVPYRITAGPDGNMWYTDVAGNRIVRITPSGVVTEFSTGPPRTGLIGAGDIVAGPDGNLWYTKNDANLIGRMTPLGVVTEFGSGITPGAFLWNITSGPDGNLWFTESAGRIGRITPFGLVTEFSTGISAGSAPYAITGGPDGNVWFTEQLGSRIGRITTGLSALSFFTTGPCRVVDTRDQTSALGGPALMAGGIRDFVVTGSCGIPANAVSVSANVTITNPTSAGTLFALPASFPVLAFRPGATRANNAFLLLAADGSGMLSFSNDMPSGAVDVIVDVNGWWR